MLFALALLLSGAVSVQATAAKPILSQVQIQTLQELTVDHGHDSHVDPDLAKALGLAPAKEVLVLRQLTMRESPQLTHAFQQTPNNGGLLLAVSTPDGVRVYRTNARQEIIAAVFVAPTKSPAAIPLLDARKALKAELVYWRTIADQDQ